MPSAQSAPTPCCVLRSPSVLHRAALIPFSMPAVSRAAPTTFAWPNTWRAKAQSSAPTCDGAMHTDVIACADPGAWASRKPPAWHARRATTSAVCTALWRRAHLRSHQRRPCRPPTPGSAAKLARQHCPLMSPAHDAGLRACAPAGRHPRRVCRLCALTTHNLGALLKCWIRRKMGRTEPHSNASKRRWTSELPYSMPTFVIASCRRATAVTDGAKTCAHMKTKRSRTRWPGIREGGRDEGMDNLWAQTCKYAPAGRWVMRGGVVVGVG